MSAEPPKPIYSSRSDDPDAGESLELFLVGLAERIDVLQDAEASGDFRQLAALAGRLASDAENTGFGVLASAAHTLESACFGGDPKLAREATLDITDLAQRVRRGHKGSI
jgi:HPt (histidine-containing phosphotransfer) domain-containing protein